jgi:putative endonuclease
MTPASSYEPHTLGVRGEKLAALRLTESGWTVLERGYRLGRREVDIIASRGSLLAFIEVKTRSSGAFGAPEEAVTRRKRMEIETVARGYLMRQRPAHREIRFDVIAIVVARSGRLVRYEHIEEAWRPEV